MSTVTDITPEELDVLKSFVAVELDRRSGNSWAPRLLHIAQQASDIISRIKLAEPVATPDEREAEVHTPKALSPWQPMVDPIDVAVLGKLLEELGEMTSAVARALIQGIDECEPVTGKPNRRWTEDEMADVQAGFVIAAERYGLDRARIEARRDAKIAHLRRWHALITPTPKKED